MVSIPFTTLNFQAERHTSSFALETVAVYKFSIWLYPTPSDIGALTEAVILIHLASNTVLLPEPVPCFTSFISLPQLLFLSECGSHMVTDDSDPRCDDNGITSLDNPFLRPVNVWHAPHYDPPASVSPSEPPMERLLPLFTNAPLFTVGLPWVQHAFRSYSSGGNVTRQS